MLFIFIYFIFARQAWRPSTLRWRCAGSSASKKTLRYVFQQRHAPLSAVLSVPLSLFHCSFRSVVLTYAPCRDAQSHPELYQDATALAFVIGKSQDEESYSKIQSFQVRCPPRVLLRVLMSIVNSLLTRSFTRLAMSCPTRWLC